MRYKSLRTVWRGLSGDLRTDGCDLIQKRITPASAPVHLFINHDLCTLVHSHRSSPLSQVTPRAQRAVHPSPRVADDVVRPRPIKPSQPPLSLDTLLAPLHLLCNLRRLPMASSRT